MVRVFKLSGLELGVQNEHSPKRIMVQYWGCCSQAGEGGGGVLFLILKGRSRVNLQASEESYAIN